MLKYRRLNRAHNTKLNKNLDYFRCWLLIVQNSKYIESWEFLVLQFVISFVGDKMFKNQIDFCIFCECIHLNGMLLMHTHISYIYIICILYEWMNGTNLILWVLNLIFMLMPLFSYTAISQWMNELIQMSVNNTTYISSQERQKIRNENEKYR